MTNGTNRDKFLLNAIFSSVILWKFTETFLTKKTFLISAIDRKYFF